MPLDLRVRWRVIQTQDWVAEEADPWGLRACSLLWLGLTWRGGWGSPGHTPSLGPAVEEGHHLIWPGRQRANGWCPVVRDATPDERVIPAEGGTELDQKSPTWDGSRSGLRGGVL